MEQKQRPRRILKTTGKSTTFTLKESFQINGSVQDCVTCEGLSIHRLIQKVKESPLSAVRGNLFDIFVATLHVVSSSFAI
jgi:hypothetical protein